MVSSADFLSAQPLDMVVDAYADLGIYDGQTYPADIERDGVASLHDTDAEAGDEAGVRDALTLDERELREAGLAFDSVAFDSLEPEFG